MSEDVSTATAQRKKGWRPWRFDQMAVMVNDRIDNPAEADVDHYVGLEHLDSDSLTIRRWGLPSDVAATKLRFRAGDIIFGRRRVYQRKLGVPHFDGICSAHAMVLRANTDVVLKEFLPFFMQSDVFMERAKQISVGSLSPTINWKTLAKEEFALPPLEEQRRIAEVLTCCRGSAEALREAEIKYNAMMHSAVRQRLADLEKKTGQGFSIDDFGLPGEAVLKTGPFGSKLKTDYFKETGRPIITIGSLGDDGLDSSQFFFLAPERVGDFADYETRPGDIVFSRVADVGRCHVIREDERGFVVSSNLIRIRVNPEVVRPVFLWLLLRFSVKTREGIARLTSQAAGRLLVNTKTMARLRFALPVPDVQDEVVTFYRSTEDGRRALARRSQNAGMFLGQVLGSAIGGG